MFRVFYTWNFLISTHKYFQLAQTSAPVMPKMSDMLVTLLVVFLSICDQAKSNERNLTRKLLEDYVVSARPVRNVIVELKSRLLLILTMF